MPAVQEQIGPYVQDFETLSRVSRSGEPLWLDEMRRRAIDQFSESGFPTPEVEDWRFTNLASLVKKPFRAPDARRATLLSETEMRKVAGLLQESPRLVFINGIFASEYSALGDIPRGMMLGTLQNHAEDAATHLGKIISTQDQPLTALNTALFQDGFYLHLSRETIAETPIHVVHIAAGDGVASYPRLLIVMEPGSQATVVEHHVSADASAGFADIACEMHLQEGAILDHYKVQDSNLASFHLANTQVKQQRGSRLTSHYFSLGGALVRNEMRVLLDGEGCEATVNGLYMAGGKQHVDNHTVIDHAKPRCASHELYKGILTDHAHGVFNGKIFVREDAQKTDAKQTNKTLLLSENAIINTKPQLEIFADDVKCTHGATVGQLEENAIFYLRSRGIPLAAARSLLTFAFANNLVERIAVPGIRAQLEEVLLAKNQLPLL